MNNSIFRRSLVVAAVTTVGAMLAVSPASASSTFSVVAVSQDGDLGAIGYVDPATGATISPVIPNLAAFPSSPSDGLSEASGIAVNTVDNKLYAINYDCEIITIDLSTGVSTPVATNPSVPQPGNTSCEGLAINSAGTLFTGASMSGPSRLMYFNTDEWYQIADNDFSSIAWVSYEPVSDSLIVSGSANSDPSYTIYSLAADGTGALTSLGTDPNPVSDASFSSDGMSVAGYFGGGYFTSPTADIPDGWVASTASVELAYFVAIVEANSDGGGGNALPATGMNAATVWIAAGLATVVILLGLALALARRRVV